MVQQIDAHQEKKHAIGRQHPTPSLREFAHHCSKVGLLSLQRNENNKPPSWHKSVTPTFQTSDYLQILRKK